jgi:hypothetical protein
MSRAVEPVMTDISSNKDLLEINKPIPFKKTTSFDKMYNEYLQTCKDKYVEFSTSNFNPDDQNSPNVFVNKLENRIKLYYNSFK